MKWISVQYVDCTITVWANFDILMGLLRYDTEVEAIYCEEILLLTN